MKKDINLCSTQVSRLSKTCNVKLEILNRHGKINGFTVSLSAKLFSGTTYKYRACSRSTNAKYYLMSNAC